MLRRQAAQAAGRLGTRLAAAPGSGGVEHGLAAGPQASLLLRWQHILGRAAAGSGVVGGAGRPAAAAVTGSAAAGASAVRQGAAGATRDAAAWQQARRQWTDGRGYQHFGGRGHRGAAMMHSPEARRRAVRWAIVLGAGGTVIWVQSREEIPYTKRKHAIMIDCKSEIELGQQTYQQVLMEARMQGTLLPQHHRATQAVRRVGMRIAQAATDGYGGGFQGHLQHLSWDFAVIHSPQVNAFVVPGGKVVVYTGLLRLVKTEDELAAVLAHECAHVVARHAAERITQMGALEVARTLAYLVFGLPIPSGPLSAMFFLPNSRKAETEADAIGIQIMARACYDPSGMVSMFGKMSEAERREGGDAIPKFLRTHPHSSDRIKAIQALLPMADGLYEMSGCEASRGALERFRAVVRNADWGAP